MKSAISLVMRLTTNSSGRRGPRTQCVSMKVGIAAPQMLPQCAPQSERPNSVSGAVSRSRTTEWSPVT
jgi:hypothetical protein